MKDRRDEILDKSIGDAIEYPHYEMNDFHRMSARNAMDEYFKERALELLQFMFDKNVELGRFGPDCFRYKGEWITKEELFEIFL